MNAKLSKKLRQYARRNWNEYKRFFWEEVAHKPFWARVKLAWQILWTAPRVIKKKKAPGYMRKALKHAKKQAKKRSEERGKKTDDKGPDHT